MAQERWQVSGSAAVQYEKHQVGELFAAWADDLLKRAVLQPGERVLDVACGTGVVVRGAVKQVGESGSAAGIDLNAGMLAEAANHVPDGFQIDWRQADAVELPFADESFDVVLCQQSLQFFPEKSAAVAEMHRVLTPGGRVGVSVWQSLARNPFPKAQAEVLGRHLGPEVEARLAAPFAYGDAAVLATLFREVGFVDIAVDPTELTPQHARDPERIAGRLRALPIADAVAAMPEAARQAMISDIGEATAPAVLSPQAAHVLTARRAEVT
jgi:ubiquinone/menaquinone biosynthesis C-methylase UbiE